jgi:DNA-binding PadR family transcriptional regulator
MFSDNTLTPREAIRLCALGTLATQPMRYGALAHAIRHFVSRILGPSLDLMGTSIELLKLEGLVRAVDGVGMEDDAALEVTDAGRRELRALLTANVRAAATELNKLIIALKFRFLHLLDAADQDAQAGLLVDVCANELARLDDLRQHHADDPGYLIEWLDHDISQLEARLKWLEDFRTRRRDR